VMSEALEVVASYKPGDFIKENQTQRRE